ncbi:MAG TPA: hypothetical protein VK202_08940 [Bacteroidia bacterium]|nr:hypothetical protein [Bacteroidia bacterium]
MTAQPIQSAVTIWTVIATIAAVVSAYSAVKSRGFAKQSYQLAVQNYSDRQANFSLYLIDGFRWISKNENTRKFLLFHITINNQSDSKNSFKAQLEIEYIRNDQSVARVVIPHNENLLEHLPQKNLSVFSHDIRVDEKGMQSRWLIFEQPSNVFKVDRIEKYTIKVIDTAGNSQSTESYMLKNLINENK